MNVRRFHPFGIAGLLLLSPIIQPGEASAQVVTTHEAVAQMPVASRKWFGAFTLGGGYNQFGLSWDGGFSSYSSFGVALSIQGGLRFRGDFLVHASWLISAALGVEILGGASTGGGGLAPWPTQNIIQMLLGAGATWTIPSTPIHIGGSLGLGVMLLNFKKGTLPDGSVDSPNSQANAGFAAAIQTGATVRLIPGFDGFVEVGLMFGRYRAGASAPYELSSRGIEGTWNNLSTTLQLGLRF